jgi:Tfp pilus assembly protein PilO
VVKRILTEQRLFVAILAAALIANVAVYAAVVYPLASRVADADNRALRAEQERRAAEREFNAANNMAASKAQAESELRTFYGDLLPGDRTAANQQTYLSIVKLARKDNLKIIRRVAAPVQRRESTLGELRLDLTLEGAYEDMREFIYGLETSPEFMVINDLSIDQGRDAAGGATLTLGIQLSTFWRSAEPHAR